MKHNRSILLSTDVDPLATPAGGVDTSIPKLAPDKLYVMTIAEAKKRTNDTGTEMVAITLKTTQDAQSTDGDVINPGFPVFHNFVCSPTGKLTVDMIKKAGASILQAANMKDTTIRQLIDDPSILVDKIVTVKTGIRKESGSYPATNEVRTWVAVK